MSVHRRRALWLARVALSLAATLAGPAGPVAAADLGDNPLDGPFIDVAVIAAKGDPAAAPAPPRLLAVRPSDAAAPSIVDVVLLGSDGGRWTAIARIDVQTHLAHAGSARLIALGDAFALVTIDSTADRTFVQLLTPAPSAITVGASMGTALGNGGAGAADVDGDGAPELVLTGRSPALGPASCRGNLLEVLDGRSLAPRLKVERDGLDLGGGAIGRLGGPGQDLIAYRYPPCATAPSPDGDGLVVVDLRTGSSRVVLDGAPSAGIGPWTPFLADLDNDGVDEVIARQGRRTVVIDPSRDWRMEVLADDAIPLAATHGPGRPNVVALYRPGTVARPPAIDLVQIARYRPGGSLAYEEQSSVPIRPPTSPSPSFPEVELATDAGAPPPAWIGDLDGSGCLDAVVPRAIFHSCRSDVTGWQPRTGPAWTMTAPLTAYDSAGSRRLLVAGGLGWSIGSGSLAVPAPLAAMSAAGGWRSAPSSPFALEELDAGDIRYFGEFPRPIVDIDPNVSDRGGPGMILGGTGGDRVFIRLVPEGPSAPSTPPAALPGSVGDDAAMAGRYLVAPPAPGYGRVAFLPVSPARTAGANRGSAWVALPVPGDPAANVPGGPGDPLDPLAAPTLAAAWRVEALALNGYGEASPISLGRVAVDRAGPNVAIDAPFLSAPWPFSAPMRGMTEPGARVRLGGGAYVDAAATGAFELRAQLAPWPQDLVIDAIDEHGNGTTQTLSVIGGIDYRQLPWQALVITAVLLGAAITTWRGPAALRRGETAAAGAFGTEPSGILDGGGRSSRSRRMGAEADEKGEIEDLPSPAASGRG